MDPMADLVRERLVNFVHVIGHRLSGRHQTHR